MPPTNALSTPGDWSAGTSVTVLSRSFSPKPQAPTPPPPTACIATARAVSAAAREVAGRSNLQPDDAVMRFGLHWGSTLYVGNIATAGRTEVTALGDEVNDAARIEACATGGRVLASKALIERLDPTDAAALGIDPDGVTYTPLADLDTATDKARRDAPALAVCDVAE